MTYQCLINASSGAFIVAKLLTEVDGLRPWSTEELSSAYRRVNCEATPSHTDFQVEVEPGLDVWASRIDPKLILPENPIG